MNTYIAEHDRIKTSLILQRHNGRGICNAETHGLIALTQDNLIFQLPIMLLKLLCGHEERETAYTPVGGTPALEGHSAEVSVPK